MKVRSNATPGELEARIASAALHLFAEHGVDATPMPMIAGQAGVAKALEILRADIERTIRLLGCPSMSELDRSYVEVPSHWAMH